MENVLERIKYYADNKGLSIRQIEQAIGASNGVISSAIKKQTDIQSKWLSIFIDTFKDVDAGWLLTGHGNMMKLQVEESVKPPGDSEAIKHLINKITEQAEEIGALKTEVGRLKKELDNVSAFPETRMAAEPQLKYEK